MGVYFVGPATGGNIVPAEVTERDVTIEAEVGVSVVITGTTELVFGLAAGSTAVICNGLVGKDVNVIRGNIPLSGIYLSDGSMYFTKVLASAIVTFSSPLVAGEYLKIQTP
jgi:hypothetical protein